MRYHAPAPAQHAVPADRFARENGGILVGSAARSRRLNGNPFGGWGVWSAGLFLLIDQARS